jgi:hypothetical protein
MEVNDQLHIIDALPQEQSLQYPLNRRLNRPWSWPGFYREKEKSPP